MKTVSVILGGGVGSRLMPLTSERSKPAVPIAGKYRLVDIPISSCINSGIRQIYVLTQFNSESLHRHIQRAYRFDAFSKGYVSILAAQQTPSSEKWFQGTADAVRQGFRHFMDDQPDLIAVLSGDQLYRIDFEDVIKRHVEAGAEITICTKPVARAEAGALGIMQIDNSQRVLRFVEKPGDSAVLDGLRAPLYPEEKFLASMGIYIFNAKVLSELLQNDMVDFGKHIIPHAIEKRRVFSYVYDGYWKDIGTIHSFWEENLALAEPKPPFDFFDSEAPIYTDMRFLPPSKINSCVLDRCLLSEGCIISGQRIFHSVVGIRASVGEGTFIEHSVLMGADYFESAPPPGLPAVGIGRDCYIRNAIVDKNARIGDGCHITPDGKPNGTTTNLYSVRDGVIVIPKNANIPAGMRI